MKKQKPRQRGNQKKRREKSPERIAELRERSRRARAAARIDRFDLAPPSFMDLFDSLRNVVTRP